MYATLGIFPLFFHSGKVIPRFPDFAFLAEPPVKILFDGYGLRRYDDTGGDFYVGSYIKAEILCEGNVLYCVLNRFEIYELKRLIKDVDASAFITISDVGEIIGNHIKKKAGAE